MSKQFWIIVGVILLAFIGVVTFTGHKSNTSTTGGGTNFVTGQGSTGVTLVEYGDYQCPYCGEYYPTVQQILQEYSSKITFQFINFPLTSIHQNAFAGARAATAAGLMGKFWQMHDLLYQQNEIYYASNQSNPTWIGASNPESVFVQYAASLGLDKAKFQSLYSSDQVNNLILADENKGNKAGINATPTFLIDGKQTQLSNSVKDFENALNNAINSKMGVKTSNSSTGTTQQSKGSTGKN